MSSHTRKTLSELIDLDLSKIYKEFKNDKIKLYKLKSGRFSIRENVSNVFESRSERDCKIEFILLCQGRDTKKENPFDNIFSEMFGKGL